MSYYALYKYKLIYYFYILSHYHKCERINTNQSGDKKKKITQSLGNIHGYINVHFHNGKIVYDVCWYRMYFLQSVSSHIYIRGFSEISRTFTLSIRKVENYF